MNRQQARARFRAVSRGRRVPPRDRPSVEEAKRRLQKADPGLDIRPVLGALAGGDWRPALIALATQADLGATLRQGILMSSAVVELLSALSIRRGGKTVAGVRTAKRSDGDEAAGGSRPG